MSKVKVLDDQLINLIAAGEVVERISSVVKELTENSIDAQATSISISLVDSGFKEILISDNGIGMDEDDMHLAILPHATSKLTDKSQLFSISTLGFRGEALASIISISNVIIKSAVTDGKGFMIGIKGGKITSEAYIGFHKGTEIQVRDLFFNTPARLSNLKSPQVELSYTLDFVQKLALSYPHIAFKLTNNGNKLFQSFGNSSLLEVVNSIYDVNVCKNMIEIANQNNLFKITGLISNITVTRSSRTNMTILVNNRVVKNNNIINAIIEGYKTLLTVGRYPICVIDISVDYSLVDVNVHPTKAEVRFSDEQSLLTLIKETVSNALLNSNLIVNNTFDDNIYSFDKKDTKETSQEVNIFETKETSQEVNIFETKETSQEVNIFETKETSQEVNIFETKETSQEVNIFETKEEYSFEDNLFKPKEAILQEINKIDYNTDDALTNQKENYVKVQFDFNETKEINNILEMHYVGQLFGTYILAQNEQYFYLIDQHAANERVNYEKIIKEIKNEKIVKYDLLLPIKLSFTTAESVLINDKKEVINNLGIEFESFGLNTFVVRSVPLWINQSIASDYIEDIFMQVIRDKKTTKEEFLDNLSKSLACKRSIKANEFIGKTQVQFLLEDLIKCENPYTCPHGRPIIIKYTKSQVEKWFKRT